MIRIAAAMALTFASATAFAGVYKCPKAGGGYQFQGTPCPGQGAEKFQYQVKGAPSKAPTPAAAPAGAAPSTAPAPASAAPDFAKSSAEQNRRIDRQNQIEAKQNQIARIESENKSLRAKMESRIGELQRARGAANNNLAGAQWETSLATEMQAITSQYSSQIQSNDSKIAGIQREISSLESAGK